MGALPNRRPWGGRWTAVYSLWTYFHRVLHILGISAVDTEELALLSAPIVRIRSVRRHHRDVVLAHHPSPLFPHEPIGWVHPADTTFSATLFFLHFDTSDAHHIDRARIATAAPSDSIPRAWLCVDHKTGFITLTASELSATLFEVLPSNSRSPVANVYLQCTCAAGRYLSVDRDTMRARVCGHSMGTREAFLINHVPLPPTLSEHHFEQPPQDCTMAAAYYATRSCPLRIQSKAFGWFLASKPAVPLAIARGNDSGWDRFILEYDSPTRSARIRDSRGLYLGFTDQLDHIIAAPDPSSEHTDEYDLGLTTAHRAERFDVQCIPHDDVVTISSRKGYLSATRDGRIVLCHNTVPGKRQHFYLRIALPSMMDLSTPRLRVRACAGGARQVDASILIPASAQIAFDVLRDYDGFHEFIHDASESGVLERRSPTELTVRMVQCHTFLVLTIPMTLVLDVVENLERRTVSMDLKHGLGIKEYKGVWQAVERSDGRCLLRCTLQAAIAVPAPAFLLDGLMSHAMYSTMEQLRVESIRRSTLEQQAASRHMQRRIGQRNSEAQVVPMKKLSAPLFRGAS
ncbi:hypothetical protein BWQ96_01462 [Gracilariopsis chorda]|uniref:Uncharacterized protein n=1 Tax=Gracilariopsis chorda TaxID=448386 RepID=A0A2V3J5F6_9FLOR|nr:hypothetical protein BWQ96_01462 [Gracilariopsis chorda]|eukprot:PXF48610.1 hypothetical protein BWQ96_01462 [Gracilariopsis chorda]